MLMYQDPSMKDILTDFCREGRKQITQLNEHLFNLEDDLTDKAQLEKFGQVIDGMMGAAKSLEIKILGTFCELGKAIGYKASQIEDEQLIAIVVAVLIDALGIIETLVGKLEKGETLEMKDISAEAFMTRLHWLSDKFKHIKRSSVALNEAKTDPEDLNNSINELIKQLGL